MKTVRDLDCWKGRALRGSSFRGSAFHVSNGSLVVPLTDHCFRCRACPTTTRPLNSSVDYSGNWALAWGREGVGRVVSHLVGQASLKAVLEDGDYILSGGNYRIFCFSDGRTMIYCLKNEDFPGFAFSYDEDELRSWRPPPSNRRKGNKRKRNT